MLLSTGFVDRLGQAGGYARSITGGVMKLYTGVPPATADAAATGTLLATLTSSGSTWTAGVQPEWGFTIGGSAGNVLTVKVGGIEILGTTVAYATGVNETAAAVAAMINNHTTAPQFVARSSGAVVYVKGPIASGTAYAAIVIATTVDGSVTAAVLASGLADGSAGTTLGVASANGLLFQFPPVLGVFTKAATVWQDSSADASGTTGYTRLILDGTDDFLATTTFRRIQFTVGTSGADITSQILTTTIATPVIMNTFALTATQAMPV